MAPTHDDDDGALQEQLARSEERYRLLVDNLSDYAFYMLDPHGQVSYWTRAAERLTGYVSEDVMGQSFSRFFTEQDRLDLVPEQELAEARDTGRAERFGWRVCKDGNRFWADEVATALYDAGGRHVGFSKVTRDISERRQAEFERERLLREATEASRLKDEFLGTISHELRTPLNAILGWLQLITIGGGEGRDVVGKALPVIERNARTLARLVDDLLDVSRIILGKSTLTVAPMAFHDPLASAIETVRPMALQAAVTLEIDTAATDDRMIGDAGRLQQVVWNLLSNAIKFTPRGGSVRVVTNDTPEGIELTVIDTGAGIDPQFLPFVFERFRQADAARTHEAAGLGLGLAMVKHWVEQHDGRITIASEGQGHGTTVRVWLPRARARPAADDTDAIVLKPHAPVVPAQLSALIVDDDEDTRRLLGFALSSHGLGVTMAASVEEGVAAARRAPPDVVITDLDMPGEDGFTLLRELRQDAATHLHDVPVIALTAYGEQDDFLRSRAAGFEAHLVKPVDLTYLVQLVRRQASKRA